jgi:ankyrin repeat protein
VQVNVRDYDSKTPLHYAAISGRDDVFQFLVDRGTRLFVVRSHSFKTGRVGKIVLFSYVRKKFHRKH